MNGQPFEDARYVTVWVTGAKAARDF